MKRSDLKYFREILIEWQEQLLERADYAIADLLDSSVNASDLLDRASLEADRNLALRIRDRESKLIRKIKCALERMDEGVFGICELCGEEIAVSRLKVRPVTTHCIDCKRVRETLEKIVGY
jgi:DnaK suppressor protein